MPDDIRRLSRLHLYFFLTRVLYYFLISYSFLHLSRLLFYIIFPPCIFLIYLFLRVFHFHFQFLSLGWLFSEKRKRRFSFTVAQKNIKDTGKTPVKINNTRGTSLYLQLSSLMHLIKGKLCFLSKGKFSWKMQKKKKLSNYPHKKHHRILWLGCMHSHYYALTES